MDIACFYYIKSVFVYSCCVCRNCNIDWLTSFGDRTVGKLVRDCWCLLFIVMVVTCVVYMKYSEHRVGFVGMLFRNAEEHNYRNKILCIKLESEVNYLTIETHFYWKGVISKGNSAHIRSVEQLATVIKRTRVLQKVSALYSLKVYVTDMKTLLLNIISLLDTFSPAICKLFNAVGKESLWLTAKPVMHRPFHLIIS